VGASAGDAIQRDACTIDRGVVRIDTLAVITGFLFTAVRN
jgi:hypothetical protein